MLEYIINTFIIFLLIGLSVNTSFGQTESIQSESIGLKYNGTTTPKCGTWNVFGLGFTFRKISLIESEYGQSHYGEYPSMVIILQEELSENGEKKLVYQCGGSLIKMNVVLTAAHCISRKLNSTFIVRAGEWDTDTEQEIYPHQDRRVSKIITHTKYDSGRLYNDVSLIFIDEPFSLQEHIQPICLPEQNENYDGAFCYSSGWGRWNTNIEYNNNYALKKAKLKIVPHEKCADTLRTTKIGPHFTLHESFLCAGFMQGRYICKGDGGGPLMCPSKSNPDVLVQVGIISWGVNCESDNIPGVYVNVAGLRNWIDNEIANYHTT